MFTGLIQTLGTITNAARTGDGMQLAIACDTAALGACLGASIACDGICLTVTRVDAGGFAADLSHETLACTTAGDWQTGQVLNLEASLRVGDSIGGHFVSGHVDGVARITAITPHDGASDITIALPEQLAPFVAPKGSISVNGISLTVNAVTRETFTVTIIPHTMAHTNLQHAAVGTVVNLEIDMLARYTARLMEMRA